VQAYLREYETIYVLRPDVDEVATRRLIERFRTAINDGGGKCIQVSNWGRKKLAHLVKKFNKGIYIRLRYLATPGFVGELERNLRIAEEVIKYHSVKLAEKVDPTSREVLADEEAPPERVYEGREDFGGGRRGDHDEGDDDDRPRRRRRDEDEDVSFEEEPMADKGDDDEEKE
jgi:small subunit ribosomal protein S6